MCEAGADTHLPSLAEMAAAPSHPMMSDMLPQAQPSSALSWNSAHVAGCWVPRCTRPLKEAVERHELRLPGFQRHARRGVVDLRVRPPVAVGRVVVEVVVALRPGLVSQDNPWSLLCVGRVRRECEDRSWLGLFGPT